MTWDYRIIDFGDHVALHEVHYAADGSPSAYAESPAAFVADVGHAHEIGRALAAALSDAKSRPVLSLSDFA
jgi:hypothetical protein